jgi:hypothetical protein
MNKKVGLLLAGLILSSFLLNFVSAYIGFGGGGFFYNLRQGSYDVIYAIIDFSEPFLEVLLGSQYGGYSSYLIFEKFLLFILLVSMVYISVKQIKMFKDNPGVLWIIAMGVPLLAIRFIDFMWLDSIFMQYQILGIILTSILPFILFFFFIEAIDQGTIRKVGWIFFVIVYYGLWSTTSRGIYGDIYLWAIVASVIFLILDGTIHRYYMWEKIRASGKSTVEEAAIEIRRKMKKAQDDLTHRIITQDYFDNIMHDLQKDLKSIYKHSF